MKREYYILILALLALTACSDKPNDEPSDLVSLDLLTPVIVAESDSRSKPIEGTFFPYLNTDTYTQLPNTIYNGDYSISFFVCDKGTFTPHLNGSNNRLNRLRHEYLYRNDSDSFYWLDGVLQARIGRNIDIYAYYPRVNESFEPTSVPFTTQQQYDWMWAEPVTINNVSTENKTVPLKFHHAMTCIEVRLSTLYTSSIDLVYARIDDKKSKLTAGGTMDLTDNGKLTYTANKKQITLSHASVPVRLPFHKADNSSYRSFCFIMPEKEFEAGDLRLWFTYDKQTGNGRADFIIPTTFKDKNGADTTVTKFETGKRYIFNLVIDNTDLIVPLDFVVDDWVTNDVNLKI